MPRPKGSKFGSPDSEFIAQWYTGNKKLLEVERFLDSHNLALLEYENRELHRDYLEMINGS